MSIKLIAFIAEMIMMFKFIKSIEKNRIASALSNGFVMLTLAALGRIYC